MGSDVLELRPEGKPWLREAGAAGILAALTLAMFADVLWRGDTVMLSKASMDIWRYFYWIREWGFRELHSGNVALWNPHILCGAPFFGNFQSALLYPLNAMFLFMDTARAMNLNIALHVFLAGLSMYLWCRGRGISRTGGVVGGAIFMFCGGYFIKIPAGHLNHLNALVWLPVFFLAVDKLFDSGRFKWSLLGGLALAMQVLAGAPQFAYYTGLAAGLYVLLNLITRKEHRGRVIAGFALMGVLAVMLSAWQVTMGMQLESHRSDGLGVEDAIVGVISPVRLLTLISPLPFGLDLLTLNVSAAGFVLAIHGVIRAAGAQRRFALTMAIVMIILSMGHYTPLFQVLYDHLPGYALFRVVGRFCTIAAMFLAMLAALGFDRLREDRTWRSTAAVVLPLSLLAIGLGIAVLTTLTQKFDSVGGWIFLLLDGGWQSGLSINFLNPILPARWRWLGLMLLAGGGLTMLTIVLFGLSRRWPRAVHLIAALVLVELFLSALYTRSTMPMPLKTPERWKRRMVVSRGQDARTYHMDALYSNEVMRLRSFDAHGYEAVVPHRYAMLRPSSVIYRLPANRELRPIFLQNRDVNALKEMRGMWKMLRVQHLLTTRHHNGRTIELDAPLGRLELIERYQVIPGHKDLLKAVSDPTFDPKQVVYLEADPAIKPEPGSAAGTVKLTRSRTDHMEISADLSRPAILLITDGYSSHWHATALPGSAQAAYDVMPANLALRAIPLSAGVHKLRLEYRPRFYHASMAVSGLTAAGYGVFLVAGGIGAYRRRRSAKSTAPSSDPGSKSSPSSGSNPAVSATR